MLTFPLKTKTNSLVKIKKIDFFKVKVFADNFLLSKAAKVHSRAIDFSQQLATPVAIALALAKHWAIAAQEGIVQGNALRPSSIKLYVIAEEMNKTLQCLPGLDVSCQHRLG